METSVILHGTKERSVILHGSKEARSRQDYFRKLVAIKKNIWQPFCFSISTEETSKLESNRMPRTINTQNFIQKQTPVILNKKYSFGTPVLNIFMKFPTATLSKSHVEVNNFDTTSVVRNDTFYINCGQIKGLEMPGISI